MDDMTALIEQRVALLDDDLRTLGVYVERHELVPVPEGMVVVIEAMFGDVALSDRVVDPEKDRVEDTFGEMADETERETKRSTFEQVRDRIQRHQRGEE